MSSQRSYEVDVSNRWVARYRSKCASCSESVSEGDWARFVDGEVMHDECAMGALSFQWEGRPE